MSLCMCAVVCKLFIHDAASHTSFSINVCVYGHHGGGPHYLVGSHTDIATAQ